MNYEEYEAKTAEWARMEKMGAWSDHPPSKETRRKMDEARAFNWRHWKKLLSDIPEDYDLVPDIRASRENMALAEPVEKQLSTPCALCADQDTHHEWFIHIEHPKLGCYEHLCHEPSTAVWKHRWFAEGNWRQGREGDHSWIVSPMYHTTISGVDYWGVVTGRSPLATFKKRLWWRRLFIYGLILWLIFT
jgi:hypothetical protein